MLSDKEKMLNRVKRVLASIEETATKIGKEQRNWAVSHSQLLVFDDSDKQYHVVAMRPYDQRQCGYKLLQRGNDGDDMRHAAQCSPAKMLQLVETLRELYPELNATPKPVEKV